jgi:glycosyltransferase involved in cell wall biosynthesis
LKENNIIVIIPLYNVEKWVKKTIMSVKLQGYKNYHCFLIDDISTDSSRQVIEKEIDGNDKFTLIVNKEKKYALKNIFDTIKLSNPKKDDIIVLLDGDDWLANKIVFNAINKVYNEKDCWMTYGSYIEYPSNTRGKFSKQIDSQVIESSAYRESVWCSSHLRTFKCGLWNRIEEKDLLNINTGRFVKAAWDLAFMFPMLEMSAEKAVYVDDLLYIYNRTNPLNEDKINHSVQIREERMIRNKKKYSKIFEL